MLFLLYVNNPQSEVVTWRYQNLLAEYGKLLNYTHITCTYIEKTSTKQAL